MIIVHTDGACEPINPGGYGGWGFVVTKKDGTLIHEECELLMQHAQMTNNVAEYTAVEKALLWLLKNDYEHQHILLKTDSNLVVNQCNGKWAIREGHYAPIAREVIDLVGIFPYLQIEHIPREYNTHADALSKDPLKDIGLLNMGDEIKEKIRICSKKTRQKHLSDWDKEFLESLNKQYKYRKDLSFKQIEILDRIYEIVEENVDGKN